MSKEKFCSNCVNHKDENGRYRCYRPEFETHHMSLVTGNKWTDYNSRFCSDERFLGYINSVLSGTCGKRARYYKSKEDTK